MTESGPGYVLTDVEHVHDRNSEVDKRHAGLAREREAGGTRRRAVLARLRSGLERLTGRR
jgi:hypothetical protein